MNISKPTDFAYHLSNYLSIYLPGIRGVSSNTIMSYRDTFTLLLKFFKLQINIEPEKITIQIFNRNVIEDFLHWIEQERCNSIATRNQRLSAIHAFFRYLQLEIPEKIMLCQEIISIPMKKNQTKAINYLTFDGIKSILSKPDLNTSSGRRDLVILTLLYDTGARVSELTNVVVGDIRLAEPATIRLTGKGKKARIVPLMKKTSELLKIYIEERNLSKSQMYDFPLFVNRTNQKLTRAGIAYILDKYVTQARITTPEIIPNIISPHCLRHSKAVHLLQAGVNLVYIRDLLGHTDIKTTEIYAKTDTKMKREALEKAYENTSTRDIPVWQTDKSLMSWLATLGR